MVLPDVHSDWTGNGTTGNAPDSIRKSVDLEPESIQSRNGASSMHSMLLPDKRSRTYSLSQTPSRASPRGSDTGTLGQFQQLRR